MNKRLLFILLFLAGSSHILAQSFTIVDSLPQGAYGAAAWGDYDNDGWMDLVYIVQNAGFSPDMCKVYHNNNNTFTPDTQQFSPLFSPAVQWADFDNDGFDDLVMSGMDSTFVNRTFIFRSMGNGTFTPVSNSITGLSAGGIDIADYNNDGWKDIAITGFDSLGNHRAFIYKGDSTIWTFTDIQASLIGVHFGELQWGDFDNDSLPDLVINGIGDFDFRTRLYKNMGADSFLVQPIFMQGTGGTVDFADFDNDGWLDILVSGYDSTSVNNITELHHNNGNGTFTILPSGIPIFGEPSAVAVADFNNDSLQDVLLTGGNFAFPWNNSMLAWNMGANIFSAQPFHPGSIINAVVEAADMDGDGDMDVFLNNNFLRNDGPVGTREVNTGGYLYPNPCTQYFEIQSKGEIEWVEMHGSDGRQVAFVKLNGRHARLDVPDVAPGVYVVSVGETSGREWRGMLLVR